MTANPAATNVLENYSLPHSVGTPGQFPSKPILPVSDLVRMAFEQRDPGLTWKTRVDRIAADPLDAAALMDIAVMLQTSGHRDRGLMAQSAALQIQRCFRCQHGRGDGLKVLAFMAAGDFMANTPIDFLLEGSDTDLHLVYVDADMQSLPDIPQHDVAFVAIGESTANGPVLEKLQLLLADWSGPILNGAPGKIRALTRDGVAEMLANEPSLLAPVAIRVEREALLAIAQGRGDVSDLIADQGFPAIVRPIGSHAGHGMAKVDDAAQLLAYLVLQSEAEFYLCPFIDYRSADGLYRKQRVAFVRGEAFASHLAISENWMVHYLNAGMSGNEARRAEEAGWMNSFEEFSRRHGRAFAALQRHIGLDYFVIDCGEMPDGRLLLFEADVAMIVHDMDPADLFPYKKPAMRRLFKAFQGALRDYAEAGKYQLGADGGRPSHFFFNQLPSASSRAASRPAIPGRSGI